MFDKLKDQLIVNDIKSDSQNFDIKSIEEKLIYDNYVNSLQNIIIQR